MYIKTALVASLTLYGQLRANDCYTCTSSKHITDIAATDKDGECYFANVLDKYITAGIATATTSVMTPCVGGKCYVKYTSKDGVIQTVDRGCLTAAEIAVSTIAKTDIELFVAATTTPVAPASFLDNACKAKIVTLSGSTVDFSMPNIDQNDLTEITCAQTCDSDAADKCNGVSMDVGTLSDCGGQCGEAGVCNHWTGNCDFVACPAAATTADLTKLQRPVLSTDGIYACTAYGAAASCGSGPIDCTVATDLTTGIAAECRGNGAPESSTANSGQCQCTDTSQVYDTAAKTCSTPTPVITVTPAHTCQQCTSDVGSGDACAAGTAPATDCPTGYDKCSAVVTFWVNKDGKSVREVIERGCTLATEPEEKDTCEFNTISGLTPSNTQSSMFDTTESVEVSCRYTCTATACNNLTPDGADVYVPTRTCWQGVACRGLTACAAAGTWTGVMALATAGTISESACAAGERCATEMTYMKHTRWDMQEEKALTYLEFKCVAATTALTDTCTTSTIGTNYVTDSGTSFASAAQTNRAASARGAVDVTICTTVCDTDSCNYHWPGQPMCHQCDLTSPPDANHCYVDVPAATACENYDQNACYVKQSGLDLNSNWAQKSQNYFSALQSMGAHRSIERGCTMSSETVSTTVEGTKASRDDTQNQVAYTDREHICMESGCNFGPALPTPNN